ncbi:VWA domain-containing protein, partial [Christensenella minuta]
MNLKRFTSFALAFILCFTLAPVNASALASESGTVKNGYYNDSGQWVEGELQQTLPDGIHSVNKTAMPKGDNTYDVTLEVVTKQKIEQLSPKSAMVLVADTSGSMNDDSRLKMFQNSSDKLIDTYAGDGENSGRYLAIVQFSTGANVVLNWTDVSTAEGKKSAKDAINNLRANEGTNLQAGLKMATSLYKSDTVKDITKENKDTVVITDGAPTYYLEKCSGGLITWFHKHVVIDGVTYDEEGSGSSGSQTINERTAQEATTLKNESTVYTVCYGAQNDYTYKKGPKVSEFLQQNIASSDKTALIATDASAIEKVFEVIAESVVSGITGENLTVTDGSAPFVKVSGLPADISQGENGFTWKLQNATTEEKDGETYYTYQLKYTVQLDADNADFKEENWYPLNGKTELNMPDGKKVKFPIPAAQGTKTRYTVTYTDGVDGEEVFKDKVFENCITGSKTPDYGETPVRDGYTFKGWSPEIEDTVTKTVVYNATWDLNLIDLNVAPVINATDKVLTVGDTF